MVEDNPCMLPSPLSDMLLKNLVGISLSHSLMFKENAKKVAEVLLTTFTETDIMEISNIIKNCQESSTLSQSLYFLSKQV